LIPEVCLDIHCVVVDLGCGQSIFEKRTDDLVTSWFGNVANQKVDQGDLDSVSGVDIPSASSDRLNVDLHSLDV